MEVFLEADSLSNQAEQDFPHGEPGQGMDRGSNVPSDELFLECILAAWKLLIQTLQESAKRTWTRNVQSE